MNANTKIAPTAPNSRPIRYRVEALSQLDGCWWDFGYTMGLDMAKALTSEKPANRRVVARLSGNRKLIIKGV